MNFGPINLIATLVGGLILAALIGWIRRARLVLQVPRLFTHSALTAKGQLAEISVFNRGFNTEEAIEVSLNPNLRYELVGSNSQDVLIASNKISMSRLGAGDDITALILVEGGVFSAADITNCLSKGSKGSIVAKLEQVPPTGPQRILLVGTFVVFPALIYLAYSVLSGVFESEMKAVQASAVNSAGSGESPANFNTIRGWSVMKAYATLNGPLFKAFEQGLVDVSVGTPTRKKDILAVPVTLANKSPVVISGTLSMKTARSLDKIPSYSLSKQDIVVSPGATVTASISVIVPAQTTNEFDKKVYIEYFLKDAGEDSLALKKTYVAE